MKEVFPRMKNVLEWLESGARRCPDKTAVADEKFALRYAELLGMARSAGSCLCRRAAPRSPVAVLMPRCAASVAAMLGAAYAGCFYAVLDADMPEDRMAAIVGKLRPAAILADENLMPAAERLLPGGAVPCSEAFSFPENSAALARIRAQMTDSDPLYALFTSGSTGTPKGVVVCHRNVISYQGWFVPTFGIGPDTVFGSQTPLYFSMSVSDVYGTLAAGASIHLIPKMLFSFPAKLIDFLNERRVNTIYWVPSALCLLANWKIFDYKKPDALRKVLFAGETMPTRQLNYWIRSLPKAELFANLFGPTETTDICAYYVVDRAFADDEPIPIGRACDNCGVFVLRDDGGEAGPGEEGELYVRGSFVAPGYCDEPEKTAAAFVQNPLNSRYPETVYRTGDLVRVSERGELVYVCRRDGQIKRMGYRIELGEVEAAASAVPEISACCALYDRTDEKLVLVWSGKALEDAALLEKLRGRLPAYMLPERLVRLPSMPLNPNGKIDRAALAGKYACGR